MVGLLATGATGCTPAPKNPDLGIVASSPTAQQNRDNMREWLRAGGSRVNVALTGDLQTTSSGVWKTDPFLTKVVADALTKDVGTALNFRPVPDNRASAIWVNYLADLKLTAFALEGVGGGYNKPGDPQKIQKAGVLLVVARRDLKQFQDRCNQINEAKGTH